MIRRLPFSPLRHALLAAAMLCAATTASAQQAVKFRTVPLNFGIHVIQAEVAVTPEQRARGLMYREKLAQNQGMIFVFEESTEICMWMKNTPLPLSVAFIDADGKIVNIADMQPHTTDSHCGAKPVKYALEMNQGWFRQKHIQPGAQLDGLPKR